MFATFFELGWRHLTEAGAWDHQLFLTCVALAYVPSLWRRWVVLATAFAVGHAAAMAGLALGWLPRGMTWVEPAIAVSIVALAAYDLWRTWRDPYGIERGPRWLAGARVGLAVAVLAFGFIHGLGFGGAFVRALGPDAAAAELWSALAAFTLGVEAGQLVLLGALWVALYAVLDLAQWRPLLVRRLALAGVLVCGLAVLVAYV